MKILYIAGNRNGSYLQLRRYLPIFKKSGHTFKIAGYKKSIKDLNADFCLDSLLNYKDPNNSLISFNGNFQYYSREIDKFGPDLILSDLDIYSSILAIDKGITLWQVGSTLLYYALPIPLKRLIGIHKFSSGVVSGDRSTHQYIKHILNSSEKKIVISHLCDIEKRPDINYGYEWARPEFLLNDDKNKTIDNFGTGIELADAFYNQQYSLIKLKNLDIETMAGISCSSYYGLGQLKEHKLKSKEIKINLNEDVGFLMELIK